MRKQRIPSKSRTKKITSRQLEYTQRRLHSQVQSSTDLDFWHHISLLLASRTLRRAIPFGLLTLVILLTVVGPYLLSFSNLIYIVLGILASTFAIYEFFSKPSTKERETNTLTSSHHRNVLTVPVRSSSLYFMPPSTRLKAIPTHDTDNSSIIHIRILEEPLTSHNLATIISSLTEIHTKCWLIEQGRYADVITFTNTHDPRFSEEAPLIIAKITFNSPAWFELIPSSKRIAEALRIAIDAILQAPLRFQSQILENRAKAEEIELKRKKAAEAIKDKEQARQIEAQKAELDLEKELLNLEKQQLEIEKERFKFETQRFEYSVKTALRVVETLRPDADEGTKAMLAQTLVPNLLQLGNGKKIELALPEQKGNKNIKPIESEKVQSPLSNTENT